MEGLSFLVVEVDEDQSEARTVILEFALGD